jgi:hypothetical protein
LHNEEPNDLYPLLNIVLVVKFRIMRWAVHVSRMEEERGVHRMSVGKEAGKSLLGRPLSLIPSPRLELRTLAGYTRDGMFQGTDVPGLSF